MYSTTRMHATFKDKLAKSKYLIKYKFGYDYSAHEKLKHLSRNCIFTNKPTMCADHRTIDALLGKVYNKLQLRKTGTPKLLQLYEKNIEIDDCKIVDRDYTDRATHARMKLFTVPIPLNYQSSTKSKNSPQPFKNRSLFNLENAVDCTVRY